MNKPKKTSENTWKPEVDELTLREKLVTEMGGPDNVKRQHDAGRMTVRERLDKLLDKKSFHEVGAIAGVPFYDGDKLVKMQPSNCVIGTGTLDSRKVLVGCDDFTIRGGAADAAIGRKAAYAERMALDMRLPMVRLIEGTGGGGSVKFLETMSYTYVPANPALEVMVELLSTVPVVSAALGPVAGLGAARAVFSHFSVMPKKIGQVFVAGPPVVEPATGTTITKEELGGYKIHTRGSGVIDNEVESEEEAFDHIKRFLSYLPSSVYEPPPVIDSGDPADRREEDLLHIMPKNKRHSYSVRRILELVLDQNSFFEIGQKQGRSVVTGLARLTGKPVGIMANDPKFLAGSIDAGAAQKMVRFVDMCDTFHIPVINFVDNPGFFIGVDSEKQGTIRHGARMMFSIYQATIPWCSIILRRVYGVAGASHGNHSKMNLRYAWPSGEWGSLPIEGGVQAAYKRQIEAADNPEALRQEIEKKLSEATSPFRSAEVFGIEEIIDPRDTRPLLADWIANAYRLLPSELGLKTRGMRP